MHSARKLSTVTPIKPPGSTPWRRRPSTATRPQKPHRRPRSRQQAGQDGEARGGAARGVYAELQPQEPAPEAKPERELTGTAAEFRAAWALTNTMSDLEDALAAHCISLAEVSREEAYASERRAALAKEAGNFAPVYREGEIVAVDGRGHVFRLNERTTGDERGEIEGRLVGLDRETLLNVADTAEAMRAASWAAELGKRQAEREEARPRARLRRRLPKLCNRP